MDPSTGVSLVNHAAEESWVAGGFVMLVICVLIGFGWLGRYILARLNKTDEIIESQHKFSRDSLSAIVTRDHEVINGISTAMEEHTVAINKFAKVIANAPCGERREVARP